MKAAKLQISLPLACNTISSHQQSASCTTIESLLSRDKVSCGKTLPRAGGGHSAGLARAFRLREEPTSGRRSANSEAAAPPRPVANAVSRVVSKKAEASECEAISRVRLQSRGRCVISPACEVTIKRCQIRLSDNRDLYALRCFRNPYLPNHEPMDCAISHREWTEEMRL